MQNVSPKSAGSFSLVSLVAGLFVQIGAQIFAISVLVAVAASAPPHSLQIYQGDYPYDSSGFWNVVPILTTLLFLWALWSNWQSAQRKGILLALVLFAASGACQILLAQPHFQALTEAPFSETVDRELAIAGRQWLAFDLASWFLLTVSGLIAAHTLWKRT